MDSTQLGILFLMVLVTAGTVFYFANRDLSKYGNRADRSDRNDRVDRHGRIDTSDSETKSVEEHE